MFKPPALAQEQENPYIPAGSKPLVFEDFQGIDTTTTRAGVPDKRMAWCDGFFPLSPRNLRTLYGIGPALFTATGGRTIVFFKFYNLKTTAYCAVFLSDGSVVQVQVSNGAQTAIAPAGTIFTPSIVTTGITQFGSQYLIIVTNQANGYFVWDGVALYGAGTLGPVITLTNVGAGYKTAPLVTATGGSGFGSIFSATIANGVVTNVIVINPGSGYLPGQTVTLVFTGGNSGGSGASLTAVLSALPSGSGATFTVTLNNPDPNHPFTWHVSNVVVNNGGSNYSQFTTYNLTFTNIDISQAPVLQLNISGGAITSVTIINQGVLQQTGGTPTASLSAVDSGGFHVTSVTINNGGSGYSSSAAATCSGGGSPQAQAVLQLVLTAGVITNVIVANGGLYGSNTPPTVTVTDPVTNAAATAVLMPFGVQGTDAETYAGRVWIANGNNVFATAPGSVTDFAVSDGGVNFIASNSNLKVGYTKLLATNGFLYLIGDSAVDYISGVTTTGSGPITTTYTYQNVDPEVGTPYPASALTFGNAFLFANSVGVQLCTGATVQKVSDDLDGSGIPNGLWNSISGNNFGGNQICSAKANIFNKRVWMCLAAVIDPLGAGPIRKLFMWNGKYWWTSEQEINLTYIAASEINSILTAYGTEGTSIYPLFAQPSTGFTKTVQSRLWDAPAGYTHVKTATRLFGVTQYYSASSPTVTVSVDNEVGSMASPYSLTPAGTGYFVWPPQSVGQQGILTGLTMKTSAADMSIVSVALMEELAQYRG